MTVRAIAVWGGVALALGLPLAVAATSPLLAWREPVYIVAGLAGVVAMALLLLQPLLIGGYLPGFHARLGRRVHKVVGVGLVIAVVLHVAALWVTSPPDVVDALTFSSPTSFSDWGVIGMWAVFLAAFLAAIRRRLRPRVWRIAHTSLVIVVAITSVIHAMLIEGTMGTVSKAALCALALAALVKVVIDLRVWALVFRRKT